MIKLLITDTLHLIKTHRSQVIAVSFMLACLLILLNVLLFVSRGASSVTDQLRGKLGMYFYIKDDATQTERTYTKVMKLKDELIKQGIQAQFSSKDDALKFLEQRLPEVLNNLKQYNIDNPLPATLYVAVSTEQEYQQLKQTILEYRSIITNVEDLDKAKTLKAQEQRIIKTIGIANGVVVFSYLLILMLFVIMVSVVIGLVRQYVYKHRRLIEVKKLLGGSYQQMTLPFVGYGISLATIGRLIAMLIICFVLLGSSSTLLDVFGIDVMTVLRDDIVSITVVCLMQLLILWILMSIVGYYTVASHMRRY